MHGGIFLSFETHKYIYRGKLHIFMIYELHIIDIHFKKYAIKAERVNNARTKAALPVELSVRPRDLTRPHTIPSN